MDIARKLLHSNKISEELTMKKVAIPIPFAGSELGDLRHVCAFFNNDEEEYNVLLPFIKSGFECGDKAVHVVNPEQRDDHLGRLMRAGIDQTAAEQCGQLELRTNTETYLSDGHFDQDRMLGVFEQLASGNAFGEFPRSRIVCQMDWASESGSQIEDLVEFEARVNDLTPQLATDTLTANQRSRVEGELARLTVPEPVTETLKLNQVPVTVSILDGTSMEPLENDVVTFEDASALLSVMGPAVAAREVAASFSPPQAITASTMASMSNAAPEPRVLSPKRSACPMPPTPTASGPRVTPRASHSARKVCTPGALSGDAVDCCEVVGAVLMVTCLPVCR
jgi:hypothetical protein